MNEAAREHSTHPPAGSTLAEALAGLDAIHLVGLRAHGHHGVQENEREEGQVFRLDLDLFTDTRPGAKSDDLNDTVDYSALAERALQVLAGEPSNLIEQVAQRIADAALEFRSVRVVRVRLHKPQAPIPATFDDVAITIWRTRTDTHPENSGSGEREAPQATTVPGSRETAELEAAISADADVLRQAPDGPREVVLALGANLGNPARTLRAALKALGRIQGIGIDRVSPLMRTAPVLAAGQEPQPEYYNAVISIQTLLSPLELLAAVQAVEAEHGRDRSPETPRWASRTLDIDIIQYQGVISAEEQLTLPHPRAGQRAFVLLPWSLMDPQARLLGAARAGAKAAVGQPEVTEEVVALAELAPDRDGVLEIWTDWTGPDRAETDFAPETGLIPLPRWSAIADAHPVRIVDEVDLAPSPAPKTDIPAAQETRGSSTSTDQTPIATQYVQQRKPLWQRIKEFFTGPEPLPETEQVAAPVTMPTEAINETSVERDPTETAAVEPTVEPAVESVLEAEEPPAAPARRSVFNLPVSPTGSENPEPQPEPITQMPQWYDVGESVSHAAEIDPAVSGVLPSIPDVPRVRDTAQIEVADVVEAIDEARSTTTNRRSIIRPTTTGTIPVVKVTPQSGGRHAAEPGVADAS